MVDFLIGTTIVLLAIFIPYSCILLYRGIEEQKQKKINELRRQIENCKRGPRF